MTINNLIKIRNFATKYISVMKRIFLILLVLIGLRGYAVDFPYLTFRLNDGGKFSFPSAGLTMNITGNVLTVSQNSFTVSNLSAMYFSATDETSGIKGISADQISSDAVIYNLNGNRIRKNQMDKGVYLVRDKNGTYKIIVK